MPLCTYVGDDSRYYPSLGVNASPGMAVEIAELPGDGRWTETPNAAPVPAAVTVPVSAPVPVAESAMPTEG